MPINVYIHTKNWLRGNKISTIPISAVSKKQVQVQ